jgi:hypothetical protein
MLRYNINIHCPEENLNSFMGYSHGKCCAGRAMGSGSSVNFWKITESSESEYHQERPPRRTTEIDEETKTGAIAERSAKRNGIR